MTSRRAFLLRAGLLATGGGALWLLRDRLPWPPLRPAFADGRGTPWIRMPGPSGLIEVPATVGGAPVRAVIDSGAQFSAIDRAVAERLRLPRNLTLPLLAYGVSGRPSFTHTVRFDLTLPGLTVPDLRAAALPLAELSRATGRDFQLLIGRDLLSRVVLDADFPAGRVRLVAPAVYRPPRDARIVELTVSGGAPMAAVAVEGTPAIDVLVDTGATGLLALSDAAARKAGLLAPGRPVVRAHSVGLGGLSVDRIVVARKIEVGGIALPHAAVQVYAPAANAPAPSGLLGVGLLGRFRMGLDLGRRRLYLAPPPLMVVAPPPG